MNAHFEALFLERLHDNLFRRKLLAKTTNASVEDLRERYTSVAEVPFDSSSMINNSASNPACL
jgi:hypothetical protein